MQLFARHAERLAMYAGLALAITLGLAGRGESQAVAQNSGTPSSSTMRIATADILGITEKLLATDAYAGEQKAYVESLNKPLKAQDEELQALRVRYQSLAPDSPERATIEKDFNDRQQKLQAAQQQSAAQLESFRTIHAGKAYRTTIEAADAVATKAGYTHVIATRSGAPTIRSENLAGALQEMLARPIVKGSAADDLTEQVLKALNLSDPVKASPVPGTP